MYSYFEYANHCFTVGNNNTYAFTYSTLKSVNGNDNRKRWLTRIVIVIGVAIAAAADVVVVAVVAAAVIDVMLNQCHINGRNNR